MKEPNLVVGLTHIDIGWIKSREEMAVLLDTYLEHICEMADNIDNFHYLIEQALHYRDLQVRNPQLFDKIRSLVSQGVLEFATGVASTIENNLTNGESFVRNMQIGLHWIHSTFGVEVINCAMIDTFGFPPQMPQILRQFGYDCLLANRIGGRHWRNILRVCGLDGSRILLMGRDLMSPYVQPGPLCFGFYTDDAGVVNLFSQAQENTSPWVVVMPYSENEVLPSMAILQCMQDSPQKYRFATLEEVFKKVRQIDSVHEVHGDLNPEFTGTYSLRHRLRILNRLCERSLLEAETVCAMLEECTHDATLENCWWEMAYTQFHDVITGSHPTAVYLDCVERMGKIINIATQVVYDTLATAANNKIAKQGESLSILNSLPFRRVEEIAWQLPSSWGGVSQVLVGNHAVPHWQVDNTVYFTATAEAMSIQPVKFIPGEREVCVRETLQSLESDYFYIELGQGHVINKIIYKPTQQVLMEQVNNLLVLQKDTGNFQIEEVPYAEIPMAVGEYDYHIYKQHNRQTAEITGYIPVQPDTSLRYTISLSITQDKPLIDIHIKVDWAVEGFRLRLKLHTPFQAAGGFYEVPFGVVERRPYQATQNSRGEWPAHRFAAIEDAATKTGIALINEGSGGVECVGGTIITTLLRAPVAEYAGMKPDDTSSDHGSHSFNFSIYAYDNGWQNSQLMTTAQAYNMPLCVVPGLSVCRPSYLHFDSKRVILSAVKRTTEGKTALRFYESTGNTELIKLHFGRTISAWASNCTEKCFEPIATQNQTVTLTFKPFEIVTILIEAQED